MTKRDDVVRRDVKRLKRAGWKVKADLRRYEKPTPIGKHDYLDKNVQ